MFLIPVKAGTFEYTGAQLIAAAGLADANRLINGHLKHFVGFFFRTQGAHLL
jgi:hypothetical protein